MVSVNRMLYLGSKPVVRGYQRVMLDLDVERIADFPAGPKIVAANHPSTTDPFFVAGILPQQSFILIKDLLFQVPILGTYLHHSGHIPVCVGSGPAAIETALRRLEEGATILIFPEGDLSPAQGGFLPARTGVARLALASGAPVIPVGVHLQRERIHTIRSTVNGVVDYGRWYIHGPYALTVGKPLRFRGDVEDRPWVRQTANNIMHHIIMMARESEIRMDRSSAMSGYAQMI